MYIYICIYIRIYIYVCIYVYIIMSVFAVCKNRASTAGFVGVAVLRQPRRDCLAAALDAATWTGQRFRAYRIQGLA